MEIPPTFNKHRNNLVRLQTTDPVFRELWEHYLEILASIRGSPENIEATTELELKRLQASLEAEIYEALGKREAL